VTGAIEAEAADLRAIVSGTFLSPAAKRRGRVSDGGDGGSPEQMPCAGDF
jgi:sulfate adenylyltransferase subunit 2